MSHEPFINIQHIVKTCGKRKVLQDINANIPKGEFVALAGPDGAGKTTLIRLIAGLLLPTDGHITIGGYDTIKDASVIPQLIGYMPQRFGLYEDLTVLQNLVLYADLKGVVGDERKTTFEKLLSFTSLAPFVKRLARDLSGGMKQKLGLACALIKKPTLLLLDEPSVGVDPVSRRDLWKMVQGLVDEGITVLWSTTYLDEAERSQSVLLLNEGKLLFYGPPQVLTNTLKGRVFKITNLSDNRRTVLAHALNREEVIDGVIQGDSIRIVAKNGFSSFDLNTIQAGPNAEIVPVSPRFEDAFVEILGGGPRGHSLLAENRPQLAKDHKVIIEANNLTKQFDSFTAAARISFTIRRGEIFGLLGPNGAGKSTIFKMMCGLLKPTFGEAYVNGLNLQTARGEVLAQIGYMAQKFSLYGDLSTKQNLYFFSGIYNLQGEEKRKIINQMIEIFGFKDYLNDSANNLPLGFKQRLALACSVMHHPEVLFLDEPTSGVDPITRREFWNHINGLVERGVTLMVTTHFMDEAEYCDRVGLVYQSKLMNVGSPDSLKELVRSEENHSPTLEEAFIYLIKSYEGQL